VTWPLYQVDAFCAEPFAGNPAAVCLLKGDEDAGWMQAVAAEGTSRRARTTGWAVDDPPPRPAGWATLPVGAPITGLGPRTGGLTEEAAWGTV
jgi:hypothetical protein